MTKSYGERRQAIYFQAARDLRKLAGHVLDDCVEEAEFTGQSASWAKNQAALTARKANDLESLGHEQTVASGHSEAHLRRSHREYSKAIDRFEVRARSFGVDPSTILDGAERIARSNVGSPDVLTNGL